MCFWKTEQSKVLRAKRDIIVYKIGRQANDKIFVPYFKIAFKYKTGLKYQTKSCFKGDVILQGFHEYINITITTSFFEFNAFVQKNNKQKSLITTYPILQDELYLGWFIIPQGATYCVNNRNEIVSNQIVYTGQYANVKEISDINLKDLWKEK